jgi:hypothetical protein
MIDAVSFRRRSIVAFAVVFLGLYLLGILTQTANRFLPYPFSNMAFYATLKALPPYNQHKPFNFEDVQVAAEVTGCDFARDERYMTCSDNRVLFNALYPPLFQHFGTDKSLEVRKLGLIKLVEHIRRDARYSNPELLKRLKAVAYSQSIFRVTEYPAPLHGTVTHAGLLARLDLSTGRFTALDARLVQDAGRRTTDDVRVRLAQTGLPSLPNAAFARSDVRENGAGAAREVPIAVEGDGLLRIRLPRDRTWSVLFSYTFPDNLVESYWGFETLYRPWRD